MLKFLELIMQTIIAKLFSKKEYTVKVDGIEYVGREVKLVVDGVAVNSFNYSPDIEVSGNVTTIETLSGDVTVKNSVSGNIETMSGDITIQDSTGNNISIETMSGDVTIHKASSIGDIETMSGNIRINK